MVQGRYHSAFQFSLADSRRHQRVTGAPRDRRGGCNRLVRDHNDSGFSIIGGPRINYLHTDRQGMRLWNGSTLWEKTDRHNHRQIFIGWQVGAQFLIKTRSER